VTDTDTTSDHYLVQFVIGSSTPPAWDTPDFILVSKLVSSVATEFTPTNTSSISTGVVPSSKVGNTISLRDERLTAGDTIMVAVLDDQLLVFVNDIIRYHEQVTGIDALGHMGIVNYGTDTGNNTYDDFYISELTPRYVTQHASADDLNNGSDPTTNAWRTIPKGYAAQDTNEMVFIGAGTYAEDIVGYALVDEYSTALGNPRKPTTKDDGVFLIALANADVRSESNAPLHAQGETAFLYCYNIKFRNSEGIAQSANGVVQFTAGGSDIQGPIGCTIQGGWIKDGYQYGLQTLSGVSFPSGANLIIDVLLQGNGYNTGGWHQAVIATQESLVAWCEIDGDGGNACTGYGIYNFFAISGHTDNILNKYNYIHGHLASLQGGIALGGGANLKAISNRVWNNQYGIVVGFSSTACQAINNTNFKNIADGIFVGTTVDAWVYSNTVASNGGRGIYGSVVGSGALITNNLAWSNPSGDIVDPGASGWTELTNLEPVADPFKDSGNDDYGIDSGSAAETGGTTLAAIDAIDILGLLRPQGASWSIGAYEVSAAAQANPIVSMEAQYSGRKDTTISLATVIITDADGDARKAYLNVTNSLTLSITVPSGVTVKGGKDITYVRTGSETVSIGLTDSGSVVVV
jgi:hypothetical protein